MADGAIVGRDSAIKRRRRPLLAASPSSSISALASVLVGHVGADGGEFVDDDEDQVSQMRPQ
eukprot:9358259-Pyramimonas_sp.AAC.3